MSTIKINEIKEKIRINHDLERDTGLSLTDLDIHINNLIEINGTLKRKSNNKTNIVIVAFSIKNNEIIRITAISQFINSKSSFFNLKIEKDNFDFIYIYSDYLDNYDDELFDKHKEEKEGYNLIPKLSNSIEVDENSFKELGLSINNIQLRKDGNMEDSLIIHAEIKKLKEINRNIKFFVVLCDSSNKILRITNSSLNYKNKDKLRIAEWMFYRINLKDISKIRIHTEYEN